MPDYAKTWRIIVGLSFLLIGTVLTAAARGQADPAAGRSSEPAAMINVAGRIVDGLKCPIPGVAVQVLADPPDGLNPTRIVLDGMPVRRPSTQAPLMVLTTDADGRFAGSVPKGKLIRLDCDKEGYEAISGSVEDQARTMRKLVHRGSAYEVTLSRGDDRDRGMRNLLASAQWDEGDEEFRRRLFQYQEDLRPVARRLVDDPIVGAAAKDWLASLADPADTRLVAAQPPKHPLPAIREVDLVDAIKATARGVNWFSANPEPIIAIRQITFTPNLDRALVECGINLGPFTGVFWHFVFHRDGKQWVLRSMTEVGRG